MVLKKRSGRMLKEHWGRYLGIVLLILAGSLYYVAATGVSGNLKTMVLDFGEDHRQEDVTFSTDRPLMDVAALEQASGAQIEGYRQCDVKLPEGELRLLTPTARLNLPAVLDGRGLEYPGEILLDPNISRMLGVQIGDTMQVGGKALRVVGTVALPNYIYVLKNLYDVLPTANFGLGLILPEDMEDFPQATVVYGARFEEREQLNEQSARLHGLLTKEGYALSEWLDAKNNKRVSMPWGNITSMQSMSLPVASAFFLLGCLIVGVVVTRTVKADGAVIGTLYALGYRRRELLRHYLTIPLLLAGIGALAGALLAMPCVRPVVDSMLAIYILPDQPMTFSPLHLALAVLIPVILIGVSSLVVIRGILKEHASDLMKGGAKKAKVNRLERALKLERLGFCTKFRVREQLRSIPRLLFLVLGVAGASMILLFGLTFNHSMDVVMKQGALAMYEYPLEYNFKQVQNLNDGGLPAGAEAYNTLRCYPEGRESMEFYLVGMAADAVGLRANDHRGDPLPRTQVNISAPLAQRLKLKVGDTIPFVNKLDGTHYSLTIDGIVEAYGQQFVYMPLDEMNRMTGQPAGSYRTVLGSHELDLDESLLAGVMDARNPEAYEELNSSTTMIVASVTALSVLMAVIILYLVTSLMIDESRNTVSLFKILGYRDKELKKLLLNSATPAVLFGFVLGIPFMLAFGNYLFGYIAEIVNMVVPMMVIPLHILFSFALMLGVYELTKGLCGRRLSKISMGEALKAGAE